MSEDYLIPLRWQNLTTTEQDQILAHYVDFEQWEILHGYYLRDKMGAYLIEDERQH